MPDGPPPGLGGDNADGDIELPEGPPPQRKYRQC